MCGGGLHRRRKTRSQALDRTRPGLPPRRGKCATVTHDYKGHGTTTLFAALNVLDGKVIGRCVPRHHHQEFIRFIATVERSVPTGKVSWLNAVEGFFSKLTRQSLKRGVFRSVDDLESAITRYIATTNGKPKPFVWNLTAKIIQAKLTLNRPSQSVHACFLQSLSYSLADLVCDDLLAPT